jgi:hydroxylysine kinase
MSEAGVLEQIDPEVPEADAERLVAEVFGVTGRAARLQGERDQNFRVTGDDGRRYLLKVANSAEDPDITDLQTRALLHIAEADPGAPTPRVRLTLGGAPQHVWTRAGRPQATVRLLTFLDGVPLSEAATGADVLEAVGAALARLDRALRDFRHPAEAHDLLWDLQHAAWLRPLAAEIEDHHLRALAEAGLALFAEVAAPRLPELRAQLIHNDLNPHNVLVDPAHPTVTGIIDLGDAVRAPLIDDVAVAAAYHVWPGDDPLAGVAAFLRGYQSVLRLDDQEIELLCPLIGGRLAMTAAISSWRAKIHPGESAYILRNLPAAVRGLEQLLRLSPAQAAERLRTSR